LAVLENGILVVRRIVPLALALDVNFVVFMSKCVCKVEVKVFESETMFCTFECYHLGEPAVSQPVKFVNVVLNNVMVLNV
jgi:hypothetical protein